MNLIVLALIAFTLIVLIFGIILMASGNKKLNAKYSNKLMALRVGLQALAIIVLALIYILGRRGT
ncbi:MAG: Hypoxia induced protein conserved region [Rickettsiaceae bacterium]|jgi:hypothetical protein|nr:Hypoxia induced protein conserved region [Rickettsiaceae bacterium]